MALGTRLQRWWHRVRGAEPPTAQPVRPAPRAAAARIVAPIAGTGPAGELKLSVEGQAAAETAAGKAPRHAAGFDPYANTAGYSKPLGWDAIRRK